MTEEVVAFDLETTGLEISRDFIVQIGLIRFNSKTFEVIEEFNRFIKPSTDFVFGATASEKTGFTKEFILDVGVPLKDVWDDVLRITEGCDMLSYNGNAFDVPMLYNNIKREGLEFDFKNRRFYDALTIERQRFPMTLVGVYNRYVGEDYENAHDALADVKATIEVFKHQQAATMEDIEREDFSLLSPECFIKRNDKGAIVFSTGKYKDVPTNQVCKDDPSYIKWVFETFSAMTKNTIRDEWYKENPKKE